MRILFYLSLVLGISFGARAESTYVTTTQTNVPGSNDMVLSSPANGAWKAVTAPASINVKAYSSALPGAVTVSGVANLSAQIGYIDKATGTATINIYVGYRRSGTDTQLCSYGPVSQGTTASYVQTGSCTIPSTGLLAGDLVYLQVSITGLTNTALPDDADVDTGPNTFVTWPQTLFVCPTAGQTCVCNGICNGNSCGSQFSGSGGSCLCNCNVAACSSLAIAGPSPLTCADSLNASQEALSWGSVPGTTNYALSRGGTGVYTGGATSFTDSPGVGTYSYSVYASGSCTPAIGGTALSGKNSQTTTNSSCSVQANGSIIICQ